MNITEEGTSSVRQLTIKTGVVKRLVVDRRVGGADILPYCLVSSNEDLQVQKKTCPIQCINRRE